MNFMSSKDSEEKRLLHFKSDNEEIIEEFSHLLLQRYYVGLEQSMKGS